MEMMLSSKVLDTGCEANPRRQRNSRDCETSNPPVKKHPELKQIPGITNFSSTLMHAHPGKGGGQPMHPFLGE